MDGNFDLNSLVSTEFIMVLVFVLIFIYTFNSGSSSSKKEDDDQEINSENKEDGE